ncbi:MAG: glycosyltransferase family 2 protein [Actinomycetota bacterium]|nr:glycosyltransferase family 2 protein [Actinomycetota bacterium]
MSAVRRVRGTRVGVVVLSHEGADLTLDCLTSLGSQDYADRLDIVVDNGSTDNVLARVATGFPHAHGIRLERNLGFSAGNNVGIAHALDQGCDHVLVLNNDTFVRPRALEVLTNAACEHASVGAVSPLLLFADDPDLIWYAGADFEPCSGMPGRMSGYRERLSSCAVPPGTTDRFTGAAVLVPADVVRAVGALDEDLFFLLEDAEWSTRIRRAGYSIRLEPEAHILHRVARTHGTEHSSASYYYGVRNQIIVGERLCPGPRWRSARRAIVALGVQLARARRARHPSTAVSAALEGLVDAVRGRMGQWRRHGRLRE